jgi:hypothetical protein
MHCLLNQKRFEIQDFGEKPFTLQTKSVKTENTLDHRSFFSDCILAYRICNFDLFWGGEGGDALQWLAGYSTAA